MRGRGTRRLSFWVLLALAGAPAQAADAPTPATSALQERADRFLELVNAGYQALYRVNEEAQWDADTDVTPAHDAAAEAAGKAYAAFIGSPALINGARALLARRAELNELTVRELERLLLNAAEGPMTNPDLVAARIAAETRQASILNSFEFKLQGQTITANEIDDLLDLHRRSASGARCGRRPRSGPALKPGLV